MLCMKAYIVVGPTKLKSIETVTLLICCIDLLPSCVVPSCEVFKTVSDPRALAFTLGLELLERLAQPLANIGKCRIAKQSFNPRCITLLSNHRQRIC
jgi:hypothetical protein